MRNITRDQARRFILLWQGLLGRHRFTGPDGACRYVRQAGCIQYDPVDVCGKNAELTLLSRVKGFTRQTLANLLYRERLLVDYADKELSIWPREDWPYFAGYRERSRAHGASFAGLRELEEEAVAWIRAHGPVSSDTLPIEGRIRWHSAMHWSGNWHGQSPAARSVLEQLYTDGVLLIHHKSGSRKFYDLAERYFDEALLAAPNPCPDEAAFRSWRVRRRIGAVGLLWNRRSDAWLGIDMDAGQREEAFAALAGAGEIVPVQAEGIRGPLYLPKEAEPLLCSVLAGEADDQARLEFLAPLDPMLWDRRLVEALWGFRYSWEIYTPAAKRRYGYYTLPILHGTELIGRIEAAADRKAGCLTVKGLWLEEGVRPTKKRMTAIARTARRLAAFNGCGEVQWAAGIMPEGRVVREGD